MSGAGRRKSKSTKSSAVLRRRKRRREKLLARERALWAAGMLRVAGLDEAGMGPLAGPIVAAAVVFPPETGILGVDDSKRLTAQQREELAEEIRARAACCALAVVDHREIDRINIYQAGLEAMRRALDGLAEPPQRVLVDGRQVPGLACPQERIVRGDATCHVIAAASILAKTERDRLMLSYDEQFPGYGFGSHKGYATSAHRDAIRLLGPCAIHRRSFMLLPHPRLFE